MDSLVRYQVGVGGETFPTGRARKWFLPCMCPLVGHQLRVTGEVLAAVWAGDYSSGVHPLVLDNARLAGKGFPAQSAVVKFSSSLLGHRSLVANEDRLIVDANKVRPRTFSLFLGLIFSLS